MAERVGFEPTNGLPRCWFSRPVLSTAQPPLLILVDIRNIYINSMFFPINILNVKNSRHNFKD